MSYKPLVGSILVYGNFFELQKKSYCYTTFVVTVINIKTPNIGKFS